MTDQLHEHDGERFFTDYEHVDGQKLAGLLMI